MIKAMALAGISVTALVATAANAQAVSATASVPAAADGAANADQSVGLEEILVTAQRRSENLQRVPIAVSAATSAKLESSGVGGTIDIGQVTPGLQMSISVGFARPTLRGIGTTSNGPGIENPIAIYMDGVYLSSSTSSIMSLANIDRIETLKGPQGTLFGRNATGGLIQIVTKAPSHTTQGSVELGYGNYDTGRIDGYLTGGLTDTLAADVAFHYSRQGKGYGENIATGVGTLRDFNDLAVRSKLLWEPSDTTDVTLAVDYSHRKSTNALLIERPGTEPYAFYNNVFTSNGPYPFQKGFFDINNDVDPMTYLDAWGASLNVTQEIGTLTFKSISAYRHTDYKFRFDLDLTPENLLAFAPDNAAVWTQFSQEFQLSSDNGDKLKWTAGLFYFYANDGYDPLAVQFGPNLAAAFFGIPGGNVLTSFDDRQKTNSYAGYGQATYEVLPETRLTLGARYTHEKRSLSGATNLFINGSLVSSSPLPPSSVSSATSFNNFSYRIALDHNFGDNVLGYLSYNTGFKSGGYNTGLPEQDPYQAEKIKSSEGGLKMQLFDRHLRFNVAGFHYDYSNIQVSRYITTSLAIYNGAKAELYGGDVDFEAILFPKFSVTGGASYVHGRFTNFPNADYSYLVSGRSCFANPPDSSAAYTCNAAGNRLANAPTFSANIGFDWSHDLAGGTFAINGNLFHSSGFFGSVDNNPLNAQHAYEQLNGGISWTSPSKQYRVELWGRNLLNQKIASARQVTPQGILYSPLPPMTFGGSVKFSF